MCLISSEGALSLVTVVPLDCALAVVVVVVVGIHGSFGVVGVVGVVELVEVDKVIVHRGEIVLAVGFLLGVDAEDDRDRRVNGHGWEAQRQCRLGTDGDHQAGVAIAQPVEKREEHAAPLGVSP